MNQMFLIFNLRAASLSIVTNLWLLWSWTRAPYFTLCVVVQEPRECGLRSSSWITTSCLLFPHQNRPESAMVRELKG